MACAIVSGYSLDCKDSVGGIKNIYLTELANVTAIAETTASFVTGITKAGGTKFFKYELEPRGQNNFTQAIQSDATVGTVAYEQTITANFVKLKYETQNKLQNLIKNRMIVIVETKDGAYWLFGRENGMEVTGGSANSGQSMNEFTGYQLTISGMEKNLANEVSSSIISGLLS
jgi:hypothetical protein